MGSWEAVLSSLDKELRQGLEDLGIDRERASASIFCELIELPTTKDWLVPLLLEQYPEDRRSFSLTSTIWDKLTSAARCIRPQKLPADSAPVHMKDIKVVPQRSSAGVPQVLSSPPSAETTLLRPLSSCNVSQAATVPMMSSTPELARENTLSFTPELAANSMTQERWATLVSETYRHLHRDGDDDERHNEYKIAEVKGARVFRKKKGYAIVDIDYGEGKNVQVVTNVKNLMAGQKVIYAPEGSMVQGRTVKSETFFGEKSAGVICTAIDMGWDDDLDAKECIPLREHCSNGECAPARCTSRLLERNEDDGQDATLDNEPVDICQRTLGHELQEFDTTLRVTSGTQIFPQTRSTATTPFRDHDSRTLPGASEVSARVLAPSARGHSSRNFAGASEVPPCVLAPVQAPRPPLYMWQSSSDPVSSFQFPARYGTDVDSVAETLDFRSKPGGTFKNSPELHLEKFPMSPRAASDSQMMIARTTDATTSAANGHTIGYPASTSNVSHIDDYGFFSEPKSGTILVTASSEQTALHSSRQLETLTLRNKPVDIFERPTELHSEQFYMAPLAASESQKMIARTTDIAITTAGGYSSEDLAGASIEPTFVLGEPLPVKRQESSPGVESLSCVERILHDKLLDIFQRPTGL